MGIDPWRYKNLKKWREDNPDYQRGANNPFWKGGLSKSNINRVTKRVLDSTGIDQTLCQDCGAKCPPTRKRWDIHHIDENRANNITVNLRVLCPKCHNYAHNSHNHRRCSKTGRYLPCPK